MTRVPFNLSDILHDCTVEYGCHSLHGHHAHKTGLRIAVPPALMACYPYNASAYVLLQQLRHAIFEYGTIEFPALPLNRTNHTLAQRAPHEHRYSSNPYLTAECQHLHQDTPPYPTAFWLGAERRHYATWVVSTPGLQRFHDYTQQHPQGDMKTAHRQLVPESLANGTGVLLNYQPGLLLIDNSEHRQLYHARSCRFDRQEHEADGSVDTPMYAYNEIGLLHYIDTLDERRGPQDRCDDDRAAMQLFMTQESL